VSIFSFYCFFFYLCFIPVFVVVGVNFLVFCALFLFCISSLNALFPMLHVFLDFSFIIVLSVFSNVYSFILLSYISGIVSAFMFYRKNCCSIGIIFCPS